jgi:transcriptional regulator with XRE-family HTH domain
MAERGLNDEALAEKIGVDRSTVTKYRTEQHRLDPEKIARIAKALDIEPEQLWRPPRPARPSLDLLLKDDSDELVQRAIEMLDILRRAGQ